MHGCLKQATATLDTRIQALEVKVLESEHARMEFTGLKDEIATLNASVKALSEAMVSSFAALNSSVKALTEAMVLSSKHGQDSTQHNLKAEEDEPPLPDTSIVNTEPPPPPPALSEPVALEGTRYYKRAQGGSRSKEVARERTPPHADLSEEGLQTKVVRSTTEPAEATPAAKETGDPSSTGSDCALISPPRKRLKLATTPRKRPASTARGKALTKERAALIDNKDLAATDASLPIPPPNKVTRNNFLLCNLKREGCTTLPASFTFSNTIFACAQDTVAHAVRTACRQLRVPRMSVCGVGAALYMKVRTGCFLFSCTMQRICILSNIHVVLAMCTNKMLQDGEERAAAGRRHGRPERPAI